MSKKNEQKQQEKRRIRRVSFLPYSRGVAFDESLAIPNWDGLFSAHPEWANKHPRTTDFLSWFTVDYESIGGKWFFLWTTLSILNAILWIFCWLLQLMTPATMPLDRVLNGLSHFGYVMLFVTGALWGFNVLLNFIWPFVANLISNQEDDDIDDAEKHKKLPASEFFEQSKKSSSSSKSKSSTKSGTSSKAKTSSNSSGKKKSSSGAKASSSSSSKKKSSSGAKTSSSKKTSSKSSKKPAKKVPA